MMRQIRLLFRELWPYRKQYALGVLCLLLCDAAQLAVPWVLGRFTDDLQLGRLNEGAIGRYSLAIVGLACLTALFRYAWRIYVFGTARRVERDLRQRYSDHLLTLPSSFFHTHKTGDLMAHATNDLNGVRAVAGEGVLLSVDSIFLSAATLALMIVTVGPRLTLLGLLPLPLLALSGLAFGRVMHERYTRVQEAFGVLSDRAQENIAGVRVVKAYVQEEAEQAHFRAANEDYVRTFLRMVRVQGLIEPLITLLAGLSFVILLGVGGTMVLRGEITLGDFIAFNSYLGMLIWPMIACGWVITLIQRGAASMGRLQAIFDEVPDVADRADAVRPSRVRGEIEVRNLTFRYAPDLPAVLRDVSFHVPAGGTLGIIGRTGSGKTTLANLLVRAFNPPPGTVRVDGHDVNDLGLSELRRSVGYVPQDAFLFSKTIRENIAFAPDADGSPERVESAALAADVHGDVAEFSKGYETLLGERGITLSGGQRQRVSIARALLKTAPILVLDDCLSAVDTATESRILTNLRPIMQGRTTIVIAHRCSAVKDADEILLLDEGAVVERGTHEELLARRGAYWRLWQLQQLEQAIDSFEAPARDAGD